MQPFLKLHKLKFVLELWAMFLKGSCITSKCDKMWHPVPQVIELASWEFTQRQGWANFPGSCHLIQIWCPFCLFQWLCTPHTEPSNPLANSFCSPIPALCWLLSALHRSAAAAQKLYKYAGSQKQLSVL